MLISFSGNNGSGKTHLSRYLADILRTNNEDVMYIREFQYFFIGRIKKVLGRTTQKIQKEVIKKRRKNIIAYLLPYAIWVDYFIYFNLLKLFYPNKTIIVDRYSIDYLNTWMELGVNNRIIEFLYSKLPKSDTLFYIDVDPEIAFKRFLKREKSRKSIRKSPKHNLNLEFYKRNKVIYKKILRDKKYTKINGNLDLTTCERKVLGNYTKVKGIKIEKFVI